MLGGLRHATAVKCQCLARPWPGYLNRGRTPVRLLRQNRIGGYVQGQQTTGSEGWRCARCDAGREPRQAGCDRPDSGRDQQPASHRAETRRPAFRPQARTSRAGRPGDRRSRARRPRGQKGHRWQRDRDPGPYQEGDFVELTLNNPSGNALMHNIDFHGSTGGLGGGALTKVNPGQRVVLRWRAIEPGTFTYHCAPGGSMIPYPVVSGMNGAVMVLPREGLSDRGGTPIRYERAYYVGEQDFYIPPGLRRELQEVRRACRRNRRHARSDADAHPVSRGLQRQGWRPNRRPGAEGEARRDRAVHTLAGQPGLAAAPDRQTRRLRLRAGLLQRPPPMASRLGSPAAAQPARPFTHSGSRGCTTT